MNGANLAQPVRDRLGRIFDAMKFRRGPDGLPRFDVLGRFVNLRGGRKKKAPTMETPSSAPQPAADTSAAAVNPPTSSAVPTPPAPPAQPPPDFGDVRKALGSYDAGADPSPDPAVTADRLAEEIADLPDNATAETIIGIIQTGLVLIGDEEGVLTPQEKVLVRRPLERVLKKYEIGSSALPAEIDLALAVLGLVVARLQKPKTATFALKVKAWFVRQFFAAKGEKLAATLRSEVGDGKGGAS